MLDQIKNQNANKSFRNSNNLHIATLKCIFILTRTIDKSRIIWKVNQHDISLKTVFFVKQKNVTITNLLEILLTFNQFD